jgi:uroporphyrinogen decarboxylase
MTDFRKFSEKYPFRMRSETPDIAIELSLQPWRRFGMDGVILFSDILTPLPALGVDFTIIEGKGPKIATPIQSISQIKNLNKLVDIDRQIPFIRPILQSLSKETLGKTSLIGFIGAPWTLAAYAIEGGHSKLCKNMKSICLENPTMANALLDHFTTALCDYAAYQIACGAQVIQVFESWAHHLSGDMFDNFAKPYASRIASFLKDKFPEIPVVYFANGGSAYLQNQLDMTYDAWSLDWQISMTSARKIVGNNRVIAGNIDPIVLYGSRSTIENAVKDCINDAGRKNLVVNLGHGVEKDTPEEAVAVLVDAVKSFRY